MELTRSTKRRRNVIVVRTAKQFSEAMHLIESGGWRWWAIEARFPGPNYKIHTDMPQNK